MQRRILAHCVPCIACEYVCASVVLEKSGIRQRRRGLWRRSTTTDVKLGNQKLYQEQKDEGKAGFVEQAVTRVVVAKHTDTAAPSRPGKRARAVEKDGRMPRLLTKLEVEHAPNRRAKNAD